MKRILLVDDDMDITRLLSEVLSESYLVSTASNGVEALFLIKNTNYDLVITDFSMPVMDGVKFLKILRKENETIKVVVSSADMEDVLHENFSGLRIEKFISKPFDLVNYEETIATIFKSEASCA
ncbi:MAG: response regulator [Bacteriovoracaceae bacterium]|nr:response regulator [Bacteriovoracaceae bacterium]